MTPPRLMEQVRAEIRARHYSRRTEDAYVHWIRRFIVFHGRRHPRDLGAPEISAFVTWLAMEQRVAASTQNQALSAVLFLYRDVLRQEVGAVELLPRARTPSKVPVVLTVAEVRKVLDALTGVPRIVAMLLYGAGLRLQECLELRVKDLDFERREITVRRGKGQKDRRVMLPDASRDSLQHHLESVRRMHHADLAAGFGRVVLPGALDRKYPHAATDWSWQFVFPAGADLPGRAVRAADPIPPARVGDTAGGDGGRAEGGVGQAGGLPHISPSCRLPDYVVRPFWKWPISAEVTLVSDCSRHNPVVGMTPLMPRAA